MILIDGSFGEGGGQILRSALTLSSITQKPFRIINIRANRKKPGLQPQHLVACHSVRKVCRGKLAGAELLSQELIFEPAEIIGGNYVFDITTAGSVVLVAQTLLPILLFAQKRSKIKILGGTHVMKSPSYDYFERVFLPAVRQFGASVEAKLIRSGYYPKGGGEVTLQINPSSRLHGNSAWELEETGRAVIRLGNLPSHIAKRERQILREANFHNIEIYEEETLSNGNALTAWRGYRGVYILGERGKRAERVAGEAIEELSKEDAPLDSHLADQLLLYAALATGETTYRTSRLTDHLHTNAYVISCFLQREIVLSKNTVTIV